MTAIGVKQNRSLTVGHRVSSEVHLETTGGLLVGRTSTWSTVLWSSVQSAAQALVLDANGDVLVAGPLSAYDVNSTVGHHERSDVWAWSVPSHLATRARRIAIIHSWNPRWLAGLGSDLPCLETLTALLADSKMGDISTGAAMRWPDDELPWARWPKGLAGPTDDPRNPTDLHRAVDSGAPAHELFRDVEFVGAADRHA